MRLDGKISVVNLYLDLKARVVPPLEGDYKGLNMNTLIGLWKCTSIFFPRKFKRQVLLRLMWLTRKPT